MSDGWQIRYGKSQLETAAARGKELFAIGYNGNGRAEAFMYLDPDLATTLWWLAHEVNSGKSVRGALEVVERRIAEHRANMAAKAGGAT
jgi:hypothetical protein